MKNGKIVMRERPSDVGVFEVAWMEARSREEHGSVCLRRGEEVDDHTDG